MERARSWFTVRIVHKSVREAARSHRVLRPGDRILHHRRVSLPTAMTASATRDAALASTVQFRASTSGGGEATSYPDFGELWRYASRLFLSWRDLKVRYAQTVLGAAWTLIQPVALMLVFTYAFSRLGNVQTQGVPYPVFALAGITFWTFFSRAVTQGSDSLVQNAPLLTKIYCPRMLIPVSSIVSALVDLALSIVSADRRRPPLRLLPDLAPRAPRAGRARGLPPRGRRTLLFSAINVRYRDIQQGLPFLVMLGLFISPVAYPIDNPLFALNPLVGIIDAFRWCFLGTSVSALSLVLAGASRLRSSSSEPPTSRAQSAPSLT